MANTLLLDANSLVYAYQAGGIDILNTYASYAASSGYHMTITDVVENELTNYNGAQPILDWLNQQGVAVVGTPESTPYFRELSG